MPTDLLRTTEAYRKFLDVLLQTSLEEKLLQGGLDTLAALIQATYAAIALLDTHGALTQFLYTGLSKEVAEKIGGLPKGRGFLGLPLKENEVLRISDISNDPRSCGFPTHHPSMQGLLLAPITHKGHHYGRVYLCNTVNNEPFTKENELLVLNFVQTLALVIENHRAAVQQKQAVEHQALLETQLRQTRKLEALGRLAGGIAHDFNNLLTTVIGNSELGLVKLKPEDSLYRNLEEIRKASQRGAQLIKQLLVFSRQDPIKPRVVDLNAIVSDMKSLLDLLIGEDIDFQIILDPALQRITIDPGQAEQVIVNLVVNARDAMPHGGKLTIQSFNHLLEEPVLQQKQAMAPGSYVGLTVKDTGSGMSEETLSSIFEPFFTTKEPGQGTGLGLSTVFGIIKQSNGHIFVSSKVGQGSTFTLYLPFAHEPIKRSDPTSALPIAPAAEKTILVVEDQPDIRNLISEILQTHGYTVLETSDPTEALVISQKCDSPIHLLITDVIMPKLNGPQLVYQLAQHRPHMKVLYISGHIDKRVTFLTTIPKVRHSIEEEPPNPNKQPPKINTINPSIAYLPKPFTSNEFLGAVSGLLKTEAEQKVSLSGEAGSQQD